MAQRDERPHLCPGPSLSPPCLVAVKHGWTCTLSGRFFDDLPLVDPPAFLKNDHRFDRTLQLESEGLGTCDDSTGWGDPVLQRIQREVWRQEEAEEVDQQRATEILNQNKPIDLEMRALRDTLLKLTKQVTKLFD